MSKVEQTQEELQKQLKDQFSLLSTLADSYDAGNIIVAKSMATTIRVLLYDTSQSHSLLGQLGLKSKRFLDTSVPRLSSDSSSEIMQVGSFCGLVGISGGSSQQSFIPYLDNVPADTVGFVSFDDYWNRVIFVDNNNSSFTRKDITLAIANQDGGAHVDPEIDEKYKKLSRENSLGWKMSIDGKIWDNLQGSELAAVRQITHEILRTFLPDYPKKEAVASRNNLIIGGQGIFLTTKKMFSQTNPEFENNSARVGRNEKCPCGSGKKYKKCHGK